MVFLIIKEKKIKKNECPKFLGLILVSSLFIGCGFKPINKVNTSNAESTASQETSVEGPQVTKINKNDQYKVETNIQRTEEEIIERNGKIQEMLVQNEDLQDVISVNEEQEVLITIDDTKIRSFHQKMSFRL